MTAGHRRGVALMVGATACWASAGVLVRNMHITGGWEITFWRSFFMTLSVAAYMALLHRGQTLQRVRAVGRAGLLVAALWSVMYICFILALARTTVANTLVLTSVSPLLAALAGRVLLGEQVPARTWAAAATAVAGIVLMFLGTLGAGGAVGNLVALAVPLCFALNVVLLRRLQARVDMIPALLLSGILSCAITLPFALPLQAGATDLGLLALMGSVQLGLGCVLMTLAVPALAAAEIGLLSELETPLGTASTWLLVGERPGALALAGGVVVLAALTANEWLALRARRREDGATTRGGMP